MPESQNGPAALAEDFVEAVVANDGAPACRGDKTNIRRDQECADHRYSWAFKNAFQHETRGNGLRAGVNSLYASRFGAAPRPKTQY